MKCDSKKWGRGRKTDRKKERMKKEIQERKNEREKEEENKTLSPYNYSLGG